MKKKELCNKCGKNEAGEIDLCPFAKEVLGKISTCNCCDECIKECLWEI